MVEILQFIFGGETLWGIPRFIGVCFLLMLAMGVCLSFIRAITTK